MNQSVPKNNLYSLTTLIVVLTVVISVLWKIDVFTLEIQGKHTWRQSMTSLNIKNFVRHDANILNPRGARFNEDNNNIRRLEFPLMQWSIAMIQRVVGESIFSTRLSVFVIGLFSLLAVFKITLLLFKDKLLASLAVWIFNFFPVYFYQSINPIPDNLALCFALFFMYYLFKDIQKNNVKDVLLAGLFFSLTSLCKLPFLLFGIMPFVYLLHRLVLGKWKFDSYFLKYAAVFLVSAIPTFLWYKWTIPTWEGNRLTLGLFDKTVNAELYLSFLEIQLKNTIPTIVVNYPSTLLILLSPFFLFKREAIKSKYAYSLMSGILVFTLYFFFVLKQIREGHDYYHMPFLPFYLILCIYSIREIRRIKKWGNYAVILLLISMPVACFIKVKPYWDVELSYFNNDYFIHRTQLRNEFPNSEKVIIVNDKSNCIVPYTIDQQGFIFRNDKLPVEWIKDIIRRESADFIFSDSRKVEEQDGFASCIDKKLATYGSINVFKLKEPDEL